ncbi:MAG: transposase family protein [Azoarcus sp.]|nr:transposase family protein [Azoarcus sp.]
MNLPQYRVLRVEETDHDYHVTAEPVDVTSACPHCQSDRLTSWGTREQVFKDLPMHGKRVGIYIDTKRLRCQVCGKTFSQALPLLAENRMMTDRLVKWIGQQSLKHTFTSLADETGVVEGTIRNIFRDYITHVPVHLLPMSPVCTRGRGESFGRGEFFGGCRHCEGRRPVAIRATHEPFRLDHNSGGKIAPFPRTLLMAQ